MKKLLLSLTLVSAVALTSCGGNTDTVATSDAQETANSTEGAVSYVADSTAVINWKGGKTFDDITKPEEGHWGVVKLKEGNVTANNGVLESGKFVADFATFESKDLDADPETKAKLDGHLKSADFLDVEKFSTASFEITGVKALEGGDYNTEISGNFDFRGVPKNITFKANVAVADDVITIKSEEFGINRKDFGITFTGGGGSIIKDEVLLQVDFSAKAN
ncbi:YceI family protein [Faecalibacter rhinopitheci]|uniref:YceI family protein n=1 Tax=Faecalibacter rhinopitheci TaxID=2779678 RepID=A0A8J7G865_9FLAO|nr:YceI family protein [Faecalibacter rhinopitheci]MBF0597050.1 YceI family protein [Faecalibacter rhinopitheci]